MAIKYINGTFSNGGSLSGYFGGEYVGDIVAESQEFTNSSPGRFALGELNNTTNPDGSHTLSGFTGAPFGPFEYNISLTYHGDNPSSFDSGYFIETVHGMLYSYNLQSSEISDQPLTCFVTGTLITTSRGDVTVENLVVGDVAVVATGDARPIVWIGHRHTDCQGRLHYCPIRVAAHAFGENVPARELRLSPGHPVLVGADADGRGGHLVPIMCLINGTSIERVQVDHVTYWHVELDQHDILLAEGLPAESYLDWGDRAFFTEGSDHALANPDFVVPGLSGRCRPVAIDGPIVEAERRRLEGVFASRLTAACAWPIAEANPAFLISSASS